VRQFSRPSRIAIPPLGVRGRGRAELHPVLRNFLKTSLCKGKANPLPRHVTRLKTPSRFPQCVWHSGGETVAETFGSDQTLNVTAGHAPGFSEPHRLNGCFSTGEREPQMTQMTQISYAIHLRNLRNLRF